MDRGPASAGRCSGEKRDVQGLDQVDDTNAARYLRRVLVACGVLPAHDEHLDRLQQWPHRALADIGDPQQRRIGSRYAHWHHLRRLRGRTGRDAPVTAGQAANVRSHVGAAAAVLAVLASCGRSLADLHQADVDQWLAEGPVARRAELGVFLHWARRERLTTVALPVEQWAGPRDPVDHDQRWRQARRLLHDAAVRSPRSGGLCTTSIHMCPTSRSWLGLAKVTWPSFAKQHA